MLTDNKLWLSEQNLYGRSWLPGHAAHAGMGSKIGWLYKCINLQISIVVLINWPNWWLNRCINYYICSDNMNYKFVEYMYM